MTEILCDNCSVKIGGVIVKNNQTDENITKLTNILTGQNKVSYCKKCLPQIISNLKYIHEEEKEESNFKKKITEAIAHIPIVTTHSPINWEYEVCGIVTSQTTTGTGIFTELFSSVSDLTGTQSHLHNEKLSTGEQMCFDQLRLKTYNMGGNAVIATDIDYAEFGSLKGMLMVCAAGTAVNVKNIEILGEKTVKNLLSIKENRELNKVFESKGELIAKLSKARF